MGKFCYKKDETVWNKNLKEVYDHLFNYYRNNLMYNIDYLLDIGN